MDVTMDEIFNNPDLPNIGSFIADEGGLIHFSVEWGMRLLVALLILAAGWAAGKFFSGRINRLHRMDATLKSFLGALTRYIIMAIAIITVIGLFGIPMASFIAVMGAAGLAVGLALQGTLSNVAAGVMLLILRPFNVGDFIEFGSLSGTVKTLSLFGTELAASDNIYIYTPNSQIWGQAIKNYSRNHLRQNNIQIGIGYDGDIGKAFGVLEQLMQSDERILQSGAQAPKVMVDRLADFSIVVNARFWTKTSDYWQTRWDMTRAIKEAFDREGVSIALPTQVSITKNN